MKKYICDKEGCDNETTSLSESKWIELGSENNSLHFTNYDPKTQRTAHMRKKYDLHFCNKYCFLSHIFKQPN